MTLRLASLFFAITLLAGCAIGPPIPVYNPRTGQVTPQVTVEVVPPVVFVPLYLNFSYGCYTCYDPYYYGPYYRHHPHHRH